MVGEVVRADEGVAVCEPVDADVRVVLGVVVAAADLVAVDVGLLVGGAFSDTGANPTPPYAVLAHAAAIAVPRPAVPARLAA